MTPPRQSHGQLPAVRPIARSRAARLGRGPVAAILLLVALAAFGTVLLDTSGSSQSGGTAPQGVPAAQAFLHRYVDRSGRVVRRDQGGDTVSEGQAYGLLIAQSVGDHGEFARIWRWTQTHLQQPNGLLAWRTNAAGTVLDRTPASDADVLVAWALSRSTGPHAAAYHTAGRRIASAVLKLETVRAGRRLLLAAGPWATGQPASLAPSYWAPAAFSALARSTGDRRWLRLQSAATHYTRSLTRDGALLPPDWARLDGALARAEPAPDGSQPTTEYGLGAQRLVVWMATSCTRSDRALAARWWRLLSSRSRAGALTLSQSGAVLDHQSNATPLVASAAAALAAGHPRLMRSRLAAAAEVQAHYPTYYGGAWLALGQALLETNRLGDCATPTTGRSA